MYDRCFHDKGWFIDGLTGGGMSAKRVLAIIGSPRNEASYSYKTLKMIEHALNAIEPTTVDIIYLQQLALPFCDGCLSCVNVGEKSCPEYRKVQSVIEKMEAADGLILSAPVHTFNVAGLMKNFCEYLMYKYSRPSFFGKKALVLTCASGGGHEVVLDFLERQASSWGYEVVGRLGVSRVQMDKPAYQALLDDCVSEVSSTLLAALNGRKKRAPDLKKMVNFKIMQTMTANAQETVNHQYWKQRNWLQSRYYEEDVINPVTNMVANFIVSKVRKAIKSGKVKPVR